MKHLLTWMVFAGMVFGSVTQSTLGGNAATNNSNTLTASITGTTGSSIGVATYCNASNRTVSSVSWTGGTFTKTAGTGDGTHDAEIWTAHNITGGTNTMTVTWSGNCAGRYFNAEQFTPTNGALTAGTGTTGTGSGTAVSTPSSLTCAPNSSADCVWFGMFGINANPASPTWTVPTTAININGSSSGQARAWEHDTGSLTQALSATAGTTGTWIAVMVTYKEPAAGAKVVSNLLLMGFNLILLPSHWFLHPVW